MKFTVCTATFNRAHTLHRVYESLLTQTFKDFEWIIIDDGSTDNTKSLVANWQSKAPFPITYHAQRNQGKHIAINLGVTLAAGELFAIADSDDVILPNALEILDQNWLAIPTAEKSKFAGVTGLCISHDGEIVGNYFPKGVKDTTTQEITYRHRVNGEKWGFCRTEVMKEFPSPHINGVPFFSESIIWHAIGRKYKTRFINTPLRVYEQDAGNQLTKRTPAETAPSGIFYIMSLNADHDYIFIAPLFFH